MNASLNEKLRTVKWGEYRLGNLFEITTAKSIDKNKIQLSNKAEYEFVGRSSENNGVQGYVEKLNYEPNRCDTFSVAQIGETVSLYREREWYASQNIFVLSPKIFEFVKQHAFITASINKALYPYSNAYIYPTLSELKEIRIQLPKSNGKIDFNFMKSFIAELEAERVAELSAYLTTSGLNNCELTDNEADSLCKFPYVQWKKYRMGDLFDKVKTQKLPYQAKELPDSPMDQYILPCLTSSFQNQGLNYYAPKLGATVLKNVISIPSNNDVYRAYFQSRDFTVLSDAYAIRWKYSSEDLSPKQYLFMVRCINKVTDRPIYSHKNKLGGWNVVKNKYIQLPQVNGEIDLDYMETFISAIQKLSIKDVAIYADGKIEKTKAVTNKGGE